MITLTINYHILIAGIDGRVWDPEVLTARHVGGPLARSPSHPHTQVSGEQWNNGMVQDVHVGRYLFAERWAGHLVRHRSEAVRNSEGLKQWRGTAPPIVAVCTSVMITISELFMNEHCKPFVRYQSLQLLYSLIMCELMQWFVFSPRCNLYPLFMCKASCICIINTILYL